MKEGTLSRIKKYLDYKGITNRAFELKFGFSNGSFASQLKNGKTIGVDRLENILCEYTDIDIEWLLTGRGSMLRDERPAAASEPTVIYNSDPKDADIIRIQTQAIDDKNKIISMQEEKIRGLEAQLSTRPTGLVTAHSVGITQEVEKRHK
ncbi:MAG: hypothetical protein RR221_07530 [Alistipes sp.]